MTRSPTPETEDADVIVTALIISMNVIESPGIPVDSVSGVAVVLSECGHALVSTRVRSVWSRHVPAIVSMSADLTDAATGRVLAEPSDTWRE